MNKIIFICLIASFLQPIKNSCKEGVLLCKADEMSSIPVICDFLNNFTLNVEKNECVKLNLDGCLYASYNSFNQCLVCQQDKVYDVETQKCSDIPSNKKVDGCSRYHMESNNCLDCQKEYYLKNGKCVSLGEEKVENCLLHQSPTICRICEKGFHLENNICHSNVANCSIMTRFQCLECKAKYIMNKGLNPQLDADKELLKISEIYLNIFGDYVNSDKNISSVCLETSVSNCSKFENFDKCLECDENYFLTQEKACERYPENPIKNCEEYLTNAKCKTCQNSSYFVSDVECKDSTEVVNCGKYSSTEDKCIECLHNFWLDDAAQTCTERLNLQIENCESLNSFIDVCDVCKTDFSKTQDDLLCLPNVESCETQIQGVDKTSTTHTCDICKEGFYQTNGVCNEQFIDNCSEYISNKNQCSKCKTSFFHSPDRSICSEQSISYCLEYIQDSTNSCSKCSSLKFLNNSNQSCDDIDNFENCFLSDGLVNKCLECLPGFFLENDTCLSIRSLEIFDKNCLSNTNTYLTSSCTRCNESFSKMTGTFPSVSKTFFIDNPTCLQIHPLTGKCNQCSDYHELDINSECQTASNQSDLKCKRIISGKKQLLSDNFHCEECVNNQIHFLVSGRCHSRSKYSNFSGCGLSDEDSDVECKGCESSLYTIPLTEHPQCVSSQLNKYLSPNHIENCLIRDGKSLCFTCQPGSYLSQNKDMCIELDKANNATIWNAFNDKMEPIGSIQSPDYMIPNCEEYGQVDSTKFACVKCKSGFIGIIPQQDSSRSSALNVSYSVNDIQDSLEFWNTFEECYDDSLDLRISSTVGHVASGECEFGFRVDDRDGFGCLQCSDNKIGQVLEVLYDIHGIHLLDKYHVIGNCSTTTINSELTGIGYHNRMNLNRLQWNMLMPFTNCTLWGYSENKVLVYMYVTNFLNSYINLSSYDDEFYVTYTAIDQAYCFDSSQVQNQISNCQVYGLSSHIANFDHDTTIISNPICLACKPGFYAVFDSNDQYITSCSAISYCSTSSHNSNTWLNSCQTPTNNAWITENISGTQVISYETPVSSSQAISNCEVIDIAPAIDECVMCQAGYTLFNNECIPILTGPNLCETIGMGITNVSSSLVSSPSLHFNSFAQLRFATKYSSYRNLVHNLCVSCPTDQFLYIDTHNPSPSSSLICGKSPFIDSSSHIPSNCELAAFNQPMKCAQCSSNFLLVTPSLTCVAQSSFPNCSTVETISSVNTCTMCQKGFYLSSLNLCLPTNCEEFSYSDPSQCAVCKQGFVIDPTSLIKCLPESSADTKCLMFSPILNHCIKCHESDHLVHIFIRKGSPDTIEGYECSKFVLEGNGYEDYNLDYPFIQIEIFNDTTTTTLLKRLETEDQMKRNFSQKIPSTNPADSHCLSSRIVPFCRESYLVNNVYCTRCQDHFYLDLSNNQCVQGSIDSCLEYQNGGSKCVKCIQSHYLNSDQTSCLTRQNVDNCVKWSLSNDHCSECEVNHRLDLTSFACLDYSAKFCEEFHPNLNQCKTCQDGKWKEVVLEEVQCKSYSAINCETYHSLRDECLTCNTKGFPTLLQDGSLFCKTRSITNCEEVHTTEDDCLVCEQGSYYNTNTQSCIIHREILNCSSYSIISPDCDECQIGFYYNATHQECLVNPNGILGCVIYSSRDQCSRCDSQFYLEAGQCIALDTLIDGCTNYSNAQTCTECEAGRVLVQNQCKTTSLTNCISYENELSCLQCSENYVLNTETKSCEPSNILNCISAQKGDPNTCNQCRKGYLLSSDKLSCNFPKIDIRNCLDYESEIKCKTCRDGFILSLDGFTCNTILETAGKDCILAETLTSPICDVCEFGFEKDSSGNCVAYEVNNCWIWDYEENKCGLCKTGTYMNNESQCIVPVVEVVPEFIGRIVEFWNVLLLIYFIKFKF